MDLVLKKDQVPKDFRERVENILEHQLMGDVIQETWGKTNFGQHFVFVVTKVAWYAVRLIVEEEYWYYPVLRYENLKGKDICEKVEPWTMEGAENYIEETLENIKNNNFGKKLRFRVRKVPEGFLERPDEFLNKGAQLQRYLNPGAKFFGIGSHEGIYLGNGRVAHVSAEEHVKWNTKSRAYPRIDTLKKFLGEPGTELRIVDHCFRQRDPESIVEIAQLIVKNYAELQAYDMLPCRDGCPRIYSLISNNCQHFANSCAIGHELMTELKSFFQGN